MPLRDGSIDWAPKLSATSESRLQTLFWLAVLAEGLWAVLQAIKVYRTKSAEDLSVPALVTILVANAIIITAGFFLLNSYQMVIGTGLYFGATIALLVGVLRYK